MAGSGDGTDLEVADHDGDVVVEDEIVGGEHGGVGCGHRHLDACLAHGRNGLNVVPVPVGLEDGGHAEPTGELEQKVVLVGRVDEHGLTGSAATHNVDIVLEGPHDRLVDLAGGIGINLSAGEHAPRVPQPDVAGEPSVGRRCRRCSRNGAAPGAVAAGR